MNFFEWGREHIGGALQNWFESSGLSDWATNLGTQIGTGIADMAGIKPTDPNAPQPGTKDGKVINYGDYNGDWLKYLQDMAASGDEASIDKLLNYLMTEKSSQTARNWTAGREDSQYQRLVADLKAAGINPYFAMQGTSPIASSSSGNSYSGNYASTAQYRSGLLASKYMSNVTEFMGVGVKMIQTIINFVKLYTSVTPGLSAIAAAAA